MNFLFVAGSLFLLNTIELSVAGQGSTPKIKEIVLGRCYEYQLNTIGPEADNWTGKTVMRSGRPFIKPLLIRTRVPWHSMITSRSLMQQECKNLQRLEKLTSVLLKKGGASLR